MDEKKEKFFFAVMFALGPPPVDNTRQGTSVGSKGMNRPARPPQRLLFSGQMVVLMNKLGILPFESWHSMEDMYTEYECWYSTQHALRSASSRL